MIEEVTYLGALLAGFISFLSPCVLPLVPPYLCYMAGVSIEELEGAGDNPAAGVKKKVLLNAVMFVFGFSCVFIALGATATNIGLFLRTYADVLSIVAGLVIIIMGLHFLGIFKIGMFYRDIRFEGKSAREKSGPGLFASFIIGLAFAFGWTPCITPMLGGVLAIAGSKESVFDGVTLLATYSLGLGVPFLIAAYFSQHFMALLKRFRKYLGRVEKIMGVLLVLTGILFLTGGMQTISFWLLENFPALQKLG